MTTKLENVRDNPRAILQILDVSESESDKESISLVIVIFMNVMKMKIVMKTMELIVNNQ
jgi:hypothetical protein